MRRVFCVILCLVLLFVSWAFPASAVAVVDDIAAAAIAVLAAVGMTFVFSGLSASGALDKVSGLLDDYAGSIGESVAAWLGTYDITMFGGKLRLAAGLATKLYGFADWVKNTYNIYDDSNSVISSTAGGINLTLIDGSNFIVKSFNVNTFYPISDLQDNDYLGYFAQGVTRNIEFSGGFSIRSSSSSLIEYYNNSKLHERFWSLTPGGMLLVAYTSNGVFQIRVCLIDNRGSTGLLSPMGVNLVDYLTYSEGEEISFGVDAGIISIPVDAAVDDVLVDVGTIPVGTSVSGVTDIIIDNALAGTLEASIEETADLPPVVAPDAVGDYTIDLTNFFPFCIPFDVYDAITLFSASPIAPNMPLKMTWEGTEYGFDIDLSPFDTVAAVLRRMEIIAFIVGLAVVTRRYIKW